MSFRFWRRSQIVPGVTLNFSKSNLSLSLGPRGAKYTISALGNRTTLGIPGSGLFYTAKQGGSRSRRREPDAYHGGSRSRRREPEPYDDPLDLGILKRIIVPAGERAFVDGLRALREGDEDEALRHFENAENLPDASWIAGILRLVRKDLAVAEKHLRAALAGGSELGVLYEKYRSGPGVTLAVTDEVEAHILPRRRGTYLALAEIHQLQGDEEAAREALKKVLDEDPGDVVAMASFAELLLADEPVPKKNADAVIRLAGDLENETSIHTAVLLYKARALRALSMDAVAAKTFSQALRRKRGRSAELLRQIRYERALAYADMGRKARARDDLMTIYAEDPDFEDVAERLGVTC